MLLFGEKNYIHFFQVYFNIQKCSNFVSLQRQNDFTCGQGELHFGVFHEVDLEKCFKCTFILFIFLS